MNEFKTELPEFVQQYITPKDFFGDEDASIEWENTEKSVNVFLHTRSYENFKNENCLYLFGRRGTGKTAIIRMLDYEVNEEEIRPYTTSAVIDQEEVYHDLSMQLRGSPFSELPEDELVHFLIKKWSWVFTVTAMVSVFQKYENIDAVENDINILKKYLKLQNIVDDDSYLDPWYRITELITKSLETIDYDPVKLGLAITRIASQVINPDFKKAERSLYKILAQLNAYCVLLIDSIEMYNLYDHISKAVITALIETVRQFYGKRNTKHI